MLDMLKVIELVSRPSGKTPGLQFSCASKPKPKVESEVRRETQPSAAAGPPLRRAPLRLMRFLCCARALSLQQLTAPWPEFSQALLPLPAVAAVTPLMITVC